MTAIERTELEHRCAIVLLTDERAALWATVTGHDYADHGSHEVLHLHGIEPAQIARVAAINGEIARRHRALDASGSTAVAPFAGESR